MATPSRAAQGTPCTGATTRWGLPSRTAWGRRPTENLDQSSGLGFDLTIPIDKRKIGTLVSSRFAMSGESETSPGRYWVYLDGGGLQSSISMLCAIGTPTGKPVMYIAWRLGGLGVPPQSAGWLEVEGE